MNISIKIKLLILKLFLLLSLNTTAKPGEVFITGQELKDYCAQSSNFCFGYVTAVVDDVTISTERKPYCLPDDMDVKNLQQVVIQFMEANPDLLVITGAGIVKHALLSTYPCES